MAKEDISRMKRIRELNETWSNFETKPDCTFIHTSLQKATRLHAIDTLEWELKRIKIAGVRRMIHCTREEEKKTPISAIDDTMKMAIFSKLVS